MEGEAKANGVEQILLAARLGEKAEDIAFVDGGDGGVEVGEAGEQHSYRVRRDFANLGQELCAVHARHAHVGDDDGERAILPGLDQSFFAAVGGIGYEPIAQHSSEGVKDEGLIVNEEDFFDHDRFLSAEFPTDAFAIAEQGAKANPCRKGHRTERNLSNCPVESCAGSPLPDGCVDLNAVLSGYTDSGSAVAGEETLRESIGRSGFEISADS